MTETEPGHASNHRLRESTDMSTILLTSGSGTKPGMVRLAAPRMLTLRSAAGTRVRCTRGRGWVTVEGDPADYWINAGEDLQIRSAGRVVIEAEQCGELVVTLPHSECGPYASPQQSDVTA